MLKQIHFQLQSLVRREIVLLLLPQAGHSVSDRGVLEALLEATDAYRPA